MKPNKIIAQRYELEELLDTGGRGAVFKAKDTLNNNQVAVKLLLHNDRRISTEEKNHFLGGARLSTELQHKHLVKTLDFGEDIDWGPFLVMEYLKGTPLTNVLNDNFSEKQILNIGYQIVSLLDFLHKKSILHGDIKPENVFLLKTEDEKSIYLKVLDFIPMRRWSDWHSTGVTPEYIPPEIFSGNRPGPELDLFALGVLLYEIAFKNLPKFSNMGVIETEELKNFKLLPPILMQLLAFNPKLRCLGKNQLIQLHKKKLQSGFFRPVSSALETSDSENSFEKDSKATEEILSLSVKESPVAVIMVNTGMNIIFMNNTAYSVLGSDFEQFGTTPIAFEKPIVMSYIQNAFESGKVTFDSLNIGGVSSGIWISPVISEGRIVAVQILITPEHESE